MTVSFPTPVRTCAVALTMLMGASALAGPAGAATISETFKEVCQTTGASPAAATAAAAAHGWKNSDASGTTINGFTVDSKVSRSLHMGDANLTLFAWHGTNKAGIQADECQLASNHADFQQVRDAVAANLAMQPQQSAADKAVFQYSMKDGAYQGIPDSSGFDAAAGAGGLHMLTVKKNAGGVFISLLKIHR